MTSWCFFFGYVCVWFMFYRMYVYLSVSVCLLFLCACMRVLRVYARAGPLILCSYGLCWRWLKITTWCRPYLWGTLKKSFLDEMGIALWRILSRREREEKDEEEEGRGTDAWARTQRHIEKYYMYVCTQGNGRLKVDRLRSAIVPSSRPHSLTAHCLSLCVRACTGTFAMKCSRTAA